jgi:hypothetical protein
MDFYVFSISLTESGRVVERGEKSFMGLMLGRRRKGISNFVAIKIYKFKFLIFYFLGFCMNMVMN